VVKVGSVPQNIQCDAVVIGGGPAGSTAAGFLAKGGRRVVLFEKERFPRYHVGESLLSATLPILDALGVTPTIEQAGFIRKPGGTFLWGADREPWSFFFREDPGGRPYAYHVVRSEFDHLLLRHCAALGTDVREAHRVRQVRYDEESKCTSVSAVDETGHEVTAEAPYVIDASGQQAMLGSRDELREFNPFFRNLAAFAYFENAQPLDGPLAGNILSAAFAEGWFWFIPLHDGTTSVGAVVDAHRFAQEANGNAAALYHRLIARCDSIAGRVRDARLVSPVRVVRDYSYSSRRFYGPGYLLAGDAACFIDPVFSTGVHLACLSGYLAAQTIESLHGGADEAGGLVSYDRRYRAAFERYLGFLYFFYDHHVDYQSYFWEARKILSSDNPLTDRESFVRLVSGAADLPSLTEDPERLAALHDRMSSAVKRGRFGATPTAELFRVRSTLKQMKDD
jgi:halogenation protein CepH